MDAASIATCPGECGWASPVTLSKKPVVFFVFVFCFFFLCGGYRNPLLPVAIKFLFIWPSFVRRESACFEWTLRNRNLVGTFSANGRLMAGWLRARRVWAGNKEPQRMRVYLAGTPLQQERLMRNQWKRRCYPSMMMEKGDACWNDVRFSG